MPELPEVETIRQELAPRVVGRTIIGVDVTWERMVRTPSVSEFIERVAGRKITDISRRGKYLFFELDGGGVLMVHLKMTGALLLDSHKLDNRFIRATISLDDGSRIFFRDPRKFGVMAWHEDMSAITRALGPEPLDEDFTVDVCRSRLAGRTAPIKAVLLDQGVIAGVGNMYADEALYAARIHPLREAGGLTADETERLYHAVREVLISAIIAKGASVVNYYRPTGDSGAAHFDFKVAHGQKETCERCGAPITRLVVRGRGTYICPECQPLLLTRRPPPKPIDETAKDRAAAKRKTPRKSPRR